MKDKFNHIKPIFPSLVDEAFPKLDIFNYYPYGPKKFHHSLFTTSPDIDLTKEYLKPYNKNKTDMELVIDILIEMSRDTHYLVCHHAEHYFDRQRIQAFALTRLFERGYIGWNKQILKGLSQGEKEELYTLHQKRYIKMKGPNDYRTIPIPEASKKVEMENRNKYGLYEIKHYPLIQTATPYPKCLYTKQQLAAIKFYVNMAFENLC